MAETLLAHPEYTAEQPPHSVIEFPDQDTNQRFDEIVHGFYGDLPVPVAVRSETVQPDIDSLSPEAKQDYYARVAADALHIVIESMKAKPEKLDDGRRELHMKILPLLGAEAIPHAYADSLIAGIYRQLGDQTTKQQQRGHRVGSRLDGLNFSVTEHTPGRVTAITAAWNETASSTRPRLSEIDSDIDLLAAEARAYAA